MRIRGNGESKRLRTHRDMTSGGLYSFFSSSCKHIEAVPGSTPCMHDHLSSDVRYQVMCLDMHLKTHPVIIHDISYM